MSTGVPLVTGPTPSISALSPEKTAVSWVRSPTNTPTSLASKREIAGAGDYPARVPRSRRTGRRVSRVPHSRRALHTP